MAETVKTESALLTEMADGGDNTAEEVRNGIVSMFTPGWVRYLDHRLPSETAHDDDDFFKTDSSADYTAITPTGTLTPDIDQGLLSIYATNMSTGDYPVLVKSLGALSAPVTIETRVRSFFDGGYVYTGLAFTDGTTAGSNSFQGHIYYSSGFGVGTAHGTITNIASFQNTSPSALRFDLMPQFYIRLCWKSSNTFRAAWSSNGVQWMSFGASDVAKTMTPTHFGFMASHGNASTDGTMTFDYFRVYETDEVTGAL